MNYSCWICQEQDSKTVEMPCLCRVGTVGRVHPQCLQHWWGTQCRHDAVPDHLQFSRVLAQSLLGTPVTSNAYIYHSVFDIFTGRPAHNMHIESIVPGGIPYTHLRFSQITMRLKHEDLTCSNCNSRYTMDEAQTVLFPLMATATEVDTIHEIRIVADHAEQLNCAYIMSLTRGFLTVQFALLTLLLATTINSGTDTIELLLMWVFSVVALFCYSVWTNRHLDRYHTTGTKIYYMTSQGIQRAAHRYYEVVASSDII